MPLIVAGKVHTLRALDSPDLVRQSLQGLRVEDTAFANDLKRQLQPSQKHLKTVVRYSRQSSEGALGSSTRAISLSFTHLSTTRSTLMRPLAGRLDLLKYEQGVDLTGQHAIVTGSNVGVGYEVALWLAWRGAQVTLACRNTQKADKSASSIKEECRKRGVAAQVSCLPLDLLSFQSVRTFAERWKSETKGDLDILVLNAGAIFLEAAITDDGFEQCYQCNVLSHFLLATLLLPSMSHSAAPRVHFVLSAISFDCSVNMSNLNLTQWPAWQWWPPFKFWRGLNAYGQAKAAQFCMVIQLQQVLQEREETSEMIVSASHPGLPAYLSSDLHNLTDSGLCLGFIASDIAGKPSYGLPNFFTRFANWFMGKHCRTSAEGAMTSLWAICSKEATSPANRGAFWQDCRVRPVEASMQAADPRFRQALWSKVCNDLGVDAKLPIHY